MKTLTKIVGATLIGATALIMGFRQGEHNLVYNYPRSWPDGIIKSIDYAICRDDVSLENVDDKISYGAYSAIEYIHRIMESFTHLNPQNDYFLPTHYNYDPMYNRIRDESLPDVVMKSFQMLPPDYQEKVLAQAESIMDPERNYE